VFSELWLLIVNTCHPNIAVTLKVHIFHNDIHYIQLAQTLLASCM